MIRNNAQKYAVLVGCGNLGRFLAGTLSEAGWSVVVIDRDAERFSELSPGFSGFTVEGDAVEFSTMQKAKTEHADLFLATTRSDSVNLMTSQVAREFFHVESVVTRISNPELEPLCRSRGLVPVSPVSVTADALLQAIGLEG